MPGPDILSVAKQYIFEILVCVSFALWCLRHLVKEAFDFCEECRERLRRWRGNDKTRSAP